MLPSGGRGSRIPPVLVNDRGEYLCLGRDCRTAAALEGLGEGLREFAGAGVAVFRLLRERLAEDCIEDLGNALGIDLRRIAVGFVAYLVPDRLGRAFERLHAGEQLVEDDSAGKDVAAPVHLLSRVLLR